MEFEVIPKSQMSIEHNFIRVSQNVREELGVLFGQFIQLRGEDELVLQILKADTAWGEGAFVSPENFKKLNKEDRMKVLEMLFEVIYADEVIHDEEGKFALRVEQSLGVTSHDWAKMRMNKEDRDA